MTFKFGPRSVANLIGVHPDLVAIANAAVARSPVDWGFTEPQVRTRAQQAEKVRQGFSKTMHSRHLVTADGTGHAVDCVPWIDGKFQWGGKFAEVVTQGRTIYPFFEIAAVMRGAAIERGRRLAWGGVWDKVLNELPADAQGLRLEVEAYKARHPGPDFIDLPHFELTA